TGCDIATDGTITCTSDRRFKKNISSLEEYGLDALMSLRPVEYQWKFEKNNASMSLGFIAQEVEAVIPKLVTTDSSTGYKKLNTIGLVPVLVKSVQELALSAAEQQEDIEGISIELGSLKNYTVSLSSDLLSISQNHNLIMEKLNETELSLNKIDYVGENVNYLSYRVNEISRKMAGLEEAGMGDNVSQVFHSFSEMNAGASTDLGNSLLENGSFGGEYVRIGEFQNIAVNKNEGLDVSGYEIENGYLTFDLFIENADLISDFHTELGNEMDTREIQWNKSSHPYLMDGWNKVRLYLGDGEKTGEIDWNNVSYFRIYFKFQDKTIIRLGQIALEGKLKATENLAENILKFNGVEFDLSSENGRNEALLGVATYAESNALGMGDQIRALDEQIKLLTEQNQAIVDFATALNANALVYKDVAGNVNIGDGKLEADGIVAGAFTIKIEEQSAATIGEAVILPVLKDENADGIDDETGSDGKSVIIKTIAVQDNSKIFLSPKAKQAIKNPLTVTEKNIRADFKVEIPEITSEPIEFDWWIVESTN
ncbi:MAG TPA: tail fiber domain-containing protein, partial [Candidatus Moranbacteria bacterium]|nr:tail fiber domain-containing protein [Candidatus Moranbacteria bacterium]